MQVYVCVLCVYCGFIHADASLAGFTRRPLLWKVNERSAWTSYNLFYHSYSLFSLSFPNLLTSLHLSFIFHHLTTWHLLICTANWKGKKRQFKKRIFYLMLRNPITVPMTFCFKQTLHLMCLTNHSGGERYRLSLFYPSNTLINSRCFVHLPEVCSLAFWSYFVFLFSPVQDWAEISLLCLLLTFSIHFINNSI